MVIKSAPLLTDLDSIWIQSKESFSHDSRCCTCMPHESVRAGSASFPCQHQSPAASIAPFIGYTSGSVIARYPSPRYRGNPCYKGHPRYSSRAIEERLSSVDVMNDPNTSPLDGWGTRCSDQVKLRAPVKRRWPQVGRVSAGVQGSTPVENVFSIRRSKFKRQARERQNQDAVQLYRKTTPII